ncbi:hypothetical protein ONZ45_g10502 [Pleurotus djamor]|nr:hypothetical protein ONZ45_g10502 [Pleurotus djamor]
MSSAVTKPEYAQFAAPSFDPNDYANVILAGDVSQKLPSELPAKEDISEAIAKLDLGIDDVSKQIKSLVTAHHQSLLSQVASVNDLGASVAAVRSGLVELDASMDKLTHKVRTPYTALQTHASRLQKLRMASELLRRTSRFVLLTRRLQAQMGEMKTVNKDTVTISKEAPPLERSSTFVDGEDEKERTIAKAALSIAELGTHPHLDTSVSEHSSEIALVTLLDESQQTESATSNPDQSFSLRSINAVSVHIPFIEESRNKVTDEMQSMVINGLMTLDQSLLASSLQTAYNLRVLPDLVQSLVSDLSQAVEERIKNAFDLSRISKEVGKEPTPASSQSPPTLYRSRVRTEPTNVTAPQYTAALWSRLENMIEEMAGCCDKVYTLEKVLKLKKDAVSQVIFLDVAMQLLDNKPSATFWTSLSQALDKHARESAKGSSFIQQTLGTGYPRLLRLFHDFFAKIAVHTDTVYTHKFQSPETILILRALSVFETLYLSKSASKLNEAVGQAFSGGARSLPGMTEGLNVARSIVNELDSARFDPLLVRSVAKNAANTLEILNGRIDPLIVRDRSAVSLLGPSVTSQQVNNAQVATCLYHCWARLDKLGTEYNDDVYAIIKPSIDALYQSFQRIVDPLVLAIRREVAAIIARLHRVDLSKSLNPMDGLGGASIYMKDLVDKLGFIKAEILPTFNVGDVSKTWVVSIVRYTIRTFVLHVSIAKPLGEKGKLQLTSDMTELEFALNAFMADRSQSKRGVDLESVGDDYRTLRALRHLLFLDNAQLASPQYTAGIPPLIVLHHILVRSPIPLPHSLHGWQEAEYVRWVDEHSDVEAWTLVDSGITHWEKVSESEGQNYAGAEEYIQLARTVLEHVKAQDPSWDIRTLDFHIQSRIWFGNFFLQRIYSLSSSTTMATHLLRRSIPARAFSTRLFSTSRRVGAPDSSTPKAPQPPKPIDDSTSALDYKQTHRARPPPLPAMDLPRSRTAEEAVTNILYNTPPPSLQPFKKHILNCLVQNEPGVLSRVAGILAGRGFNIDSLVVCRTEIRDLSRMCIVINGQDGVVEQARRQLEDLVPVWAVLDYTDTRTISRELLLVKVSILGQEYVDDQLLGGPTHAPVQALSSTPEPHSKLEREAALAHNFETSGHPDELAATTPVTHVPLTPSQALRLKYQHLQSITTLSHQFGAKVVDVSEHSVIVELTAKTTRVEAFLNLLKPFGILEAARTGLMAMPRTPINNVLEDEEMIGDDVAIDASQLPPG